MVISVFQKMSDSPMYTQSSWTDTIPYLQTSTKCLWSFAKGLNFLKHVVNMRKGH